MRRVLIYCSTPKTLWIGILTEGFQPHRAVAWAAPDGAEMRVPLLQGHAMSKGKATAFVCTDRVSRPPVTDVGELRHLLDASRR